MPIADPAAMSPMKCCERYTLENAAAHATSSMADFRKIFFVYRHTQKHNPNIEALCPDGKLYVP